MNQPRGSDEGNQGRPGGGDAPDLPPLPPGWAAIHIPDDARELAAEAAIVRAELALDPTWPPRRRSRYATVGPVIALIVMVTISVASLLLIVRPVGSTPPHAAPLAPASEAVGTVGGLLPDITLLDAAQRPIEVRSVRPALLLLIPDECDCADRAARFVEASGASMVRVELVGNVGAPTLPAGSMFDRVGALHDPGGLLTSALTPRQPDVSAPASGAHVPASITAVLIQSDGVIAHILRDPAITAELKNDLAALTI